MDNNQKIRELVDKVYSGNNEVKPQSADLLIRLIEDKSTNLGYDEVIGRLEKLSRYVSKLRVCGISMDLQINVYHTGSKVRLLTEVNEIKASEEADFVFDCGDMDNGDIVLGYKTFLYNQQIKLDIRRLNLDNQPLYVFQSISSWIANDVKGYRNILVYDNSTVDRLSDSIQRFDKDYFDTLDGKSAEAYSITWLLATIANLIKSKQMLRRKSLTTNDERITDMLFDMINIMIDFESIEVDEFWKMVGKLNKLIQLSVNKESPNYDKYSRVVLNEVSKIYTKVSIYQNKQLRNR